MALPLIILLLVCYGYTLLVFLFYLEADQEPDSAGDSIKSTRSVSVVVPFKNEKDHLPGLLDDLSRQSFPNELLEVIFVDDHSGDSSASILTKMKDSNAGFRYLSLPPGVSGKKKALSHGIEYAEYDWIIQVDADCRLGPGFISAHMAFLEKHPSDLVAGIVTIGKGSGSFLESFERLDVLALAGSSAGSFGLGRPMMCSGANLMYRRELHQESRDFDPDELASGDDMFLLIGARKLGKRSCYNIDPEALVLTPAQKSWSGLLRQRMRWGAKSTHYPMPDIKAVAFLVALANLLLALLPLWLCLFPEALGVLLLTAGLKFMMDFILIRAMAGMVKQQAVLRWYLPVALLYPYYMVLLLLAMPFRGRQW